MTDTYNIEGHKLYWHMDRVNDWLMGKRIAPISIDMGITQTCNIGCKYCYYSTPENRTNKRVPTDALLRLIRDCAEIGTKSISFAGDGEPMIHPGVYKAVIEGARAGLDMAISTNGVTFKHGKLKEFLESLTWIRFSISAASPGKYETVMGASRKIYFKVLDNIKNCVQLKKEYDMGVTIGIQMVLVPECIDEIVAYAKLGRELGVDYAVIKQCSESAGVKLNFSINEYEKYDSLMREAETYSDNNYNVIIKRKKIQTNNRNYDNCYGCEFLSQISGAGEVSCCGNFFGNRKFIIGNIVNESFKDIVFGERYKKIMDKVKSEVDVHKACGSKCRVNEINEFLWMIKKPPQHINFI